MGQSPREEQLLAARTHHHPSVVVGVGDVAVAQEGSILVTHGLGSCVAVCVRCDGWGGMLHYMLPSSRVDAKRALTQPALFGDTGFAALFRELQLRTRLERPTVKLVGGASIGIASGLGLGRRNALAGRKQVWSRSLPLVAEELEGTVSRTVYFDVATGVVTIRTPGLPEHSI